MSNSGATILGIPARFLPNSVFRIPFLDIFIPSKTIFHIKDRNTMQFIKEADLSATARSLLRFLISRSTDTGFTSLQISNLADELNISENTARKYIRELEEKGFIRRFFDQETSKFVFVLMLSAILPLLYSCGIALLDNVESVLANIYAKISEEYRRRNPYASSLDDYCKTKEAEEAKRSEAIRTGGSLGGKVRAAQRNKSASVAENEPEVPDGASKFEARASNFEAPSIIIYKSLENTPPPPTPAEESLNLSHETSNQNESSPSLQNKTSQNAAGMIQSAATVFATENGLKTAEKSQSTTVPSDKPEQETAETDRQTVVTWVSEFQKLVARREPRFSNEAPLYTMSPEGIPVFCEDPRLTAAQNATRYVDFQKLVNFAKNNALQEISKPQRVHFKKTEHHVSQPSSVNSSQKRDEEAETYAAEHDMNVGVVKVVYRMVPEDARREDLLKFLRTYPKTTAYLDAICKEWLRLQKLGELPSIEKILESIEAHLEYKWTLDSSRQYIPDPLSYLKNEMWIYAEQWKPRCQPQAATVHAEYVEHKRAPEEQARFDSISNVVNELKNHFNVVTGQIYGAFYKARIRSAEKLESVLDELPTFTGTLDEWLGSVKVRLA